MLTDLPHTDTRPARMGTLEHHGEQVRGKGGIRETCRLAKPYDALVLSNFVLLHHTPRRMVRIGQLGKGVAEGGSSLLHRAELRGDAAAPLLELTLGISAVPGVQILPVFFLVRDHPAHPLRYQLILGSEVAVERHLVRLRGLGDRFDAYAAYSLFMKQVASRHEKPLAKRDSVADWFFRFRPLAVNICLHDKLYPSLTKMLPVGNMGVPMKCYRSVTYYSSTRSATMGCGNLALRSCANWFPLSPAPSPFP